MAAAAFALASVRPGLAADAPLKVIRHMTFDLKYDSQSTIQTKVSGIGGGPDSGLATNDGPATDRRSTISVDVVAVTADGGIAVDVSEDRTPTFRAGIIGNELMIGANAPVTEEEQAILPYLARGFVKADSVAVGATWAANSSTGGVSQKTTYTIKSVDADAQTITLEISGSTTAGGPKAFDATTTGSMTYDIRKVVPLKLDLTTRTVVSRGDRIATVVSHVASSLGDDTFQKT